MLKCAEPLQRASLTPLSKICEQGGFLKLIIGLLINELSYIDSHVAYDK